MSIRIAVAGAAGRMGRQVVKAVHGDPETELVAAVDVASTAEDAGELAGVGELEVKIGTDLGQALKTSRAEVLVDFTRASAAYENARTALDHGVSPVIGTTGMSPDRVKELERLAKE